MDKLTLTLNTLLIIFIFVLNLYLTLLSNRDDRMLLKEDNFECKEMLLRINKDSRIGYIANTIISCICLVMLCFAKPGILAIIGEVIFSLYAFNRMYIVIKSFYYATETQRGLYENWVFSIVEDIEKMNLSKEESEDLYEKRVMNLILDKNISTCKFDKVMKDLGKRLDNISKDINKVK